MTRREWRALSPVLLLVMVLSLVIGMIVHADAFRERVQDLNSSGVWVTSDARLVFARMNRVAGSLDTLISDPSQQQAYHLDVLQDGDSVLGLQRDLGRLFPIDARDSQVVEGVELVVEPASRVAMGGGVLALVTPSGEVRVTAYGKGQIPDPRLLMTERALVTQLEAGMVPGFDITVDANGWVLAASTSGQWALITPGADPIVDSVLPLSSVQVTLVAGTGVIADPALAVVQTTSGQYFQLGSAIALQQASTSGDQVGVATTTGLVALPLGDDSDLVKDLYALPDRVERMPAAPVVMGGYIYGAWSGPAVNQVWIGPDGEAHEQLTDQADRALIDPVFRVNFGSIYLNDLRTGWVFDLIEQLAIEELEEEPQETSPEPQDGPRPNDPVKAIDDHLWVRPGTTSILHVLDNDLNPGGGLLAIRSVGVPNVGTVEISPNGQTIIYRAPQNASGDVVFTYTVSSRSLIDEEDLSSTAAVTVSMRPVNENSAPYIREGLPERRYSVISSGTIAISPLADWRDDDSDPLVIVEAVGAQGRIIPVTNQSVIRYSASPTEVSIDEVITYTVADSNGELTSGELVVQILRALAQEGIPPVANSDVVRGVIGQPLTISPLDNDQPGAAPLLGSAKLRLASPVDGLIGLSVETDLASGVVTVVGTRVGVYLLTYTAAYGALTDTAFIRVDIAEQGSLVAMPDAMVLRGMVGGYVDVLVNDHDPSGSVLTVVSAQAREPNLFGIAVVQGRWLWVQAKAETATSDVSVVDYVVTDGRGNEAIGQVCVTLRPAVADDTVRTVDDHAVVRAGDVTLVAVLDNDVAASGRPLVLNDNAPGLPPGELKVQDLAAPNESTADQVGRAFVDGVNVRYVAPAVVTAVLLVRVEYQASVPGGTPVTGSLWVEVRPAPDPPGGQLVNRAPTPVSLEVRCVLGSTVEIAVSPYGQDPDGDSVAVTGIAQPPKYGRVVEIIGNTLIYESYPD
ncbi:MAG: hypothetical protein LBE83_05280, partial [Propionibacteriaceae bacterium]|nr:hypothetical protein [Propionibacteriaceae bacterium]